jgi:hypothetical protein
MKNHLLSLLPLLFLFHPAIAQFREDFDAATPAFASQGLPGWNAITGDGTGIFT